MAKRKLTHSFISNLDLPDKRKEISDTVADGLALRVTKTGHKSFVFRYRFGNKVRRFTIGTFGMVSLAAARREAENLHIKVKKGIDPQAEKQANRNRPDPKTVGDLAALFKKKHLPTLRDSTQKSYTARIDSIILPALKNVPAKELSRMDIIEMLDELVYERGEDVNANRVRAILSSMYSFGVQRGIAEYNPVKTIKPLGKEKSRDRVYDEDEIKALWKAFEQQPEPSQSIFKMLLLTGQRKGETCRMQWNDIQDRIWTIPKNQTKANRTHHVPLIDKAYEILEKLHPLTGKSAYVFQSTFKKNQPITRLSDAVERVREISGVDDFRMHDLRRTAATYMAESGTERTIIGKVLNHKGLAGDNQVTARYDRYDYMKEKRTALNRWAHKLQQIIEGTETKITKIGA